MNQQELETWWSYWTPEHFEADERDTNGGRYFPLSDCDSQAKPGRKDGDG